MELTARFDEALALALRLHRDQKRKGTDLPYFTHLMAVTAMVIEDGGDEDQAIAALLHDAAEDQGGEKTLETIRLQFGERVSEIVRGCSDTFEMPKPPWRNRKESYLEHLRVASVEVRRVSLADKVHNARSTLYDLQRVGEIVWERFRGGKEGTMWYYQALVEEFAAERSPLADELRSVVERLSRIASGA